MKSKRVLAFLVLAVFPPAALTACGSLFHKDVDAGADAAVVVDAEVASVVVEEPAASSVASVTPVAPVAVKHTDAGVRADASAPVATVDAGAIPRPIPSGLRLPGLPSGLPSGLRVPAGFPSKFVPR